MGEGNTPSNLKYTHVTYETSNVMVHLDT